jgi:hypothetical protein
MLKKSFKEYHNKFQFSDFDNDLVGLFIDCVSWLREIVKTCSEKNIDLEEIKDPENYHKFPPHYVSMVHRENIRYMLGRIFKDETDDDIFLINSYVAIFASCYTYNFPIEKIKELILNDEELNREKALQILLDDGMAKQIHKEPSDTDYSNLFL